MSEHQEQQNFFNWVRRNRRFSLNPEIRKAMKLCYAIPNGAAIKDFQKMKMEGMEKGILDVNLDWPVTIIKPKKSHSLIDRLITIAGLRLEFKYKKPPISDKIQALINTENYLVDLSPEQKETRLLLIEAGYKVCIPYSAEQAIQMVIDYLPFFETDYVKPKYL
jgi:hypothetical protein